MMVFDGSFPVNDRWFWRLLVSYSASPRVEPPQKAQLTRPGSIICPVRPYFLQTAATETFTELRELLKRAAHRLHPKAAQRRASSRQAVCIAAGVK